MNATNPDVNSPVISGDQGGMPDGWLRPRPNSQRTLFPKLTAEALASLGVSRGDVRRWRELGWVSFDVDGIEHIDQPEEWEITFVRNIARSGLSGRQIDELLATLAKPLRYDPKSTVYHFAYGWVAPCPEHPFDVVDREVDAWVESLAQNRQMDRLRALAEAVDAALASDAEEA